MKDIQAPTATNHGLPFPDKHYELEPRRVLFSGNEDVAGCKIFWGWVFRLNGHTSPDERRNLKAVGWRFSGGKWCRRDDDPTYIVGHEQDDCRDVTQAHAPVEDAPSCLGSSNMSGQDKATAR